MLSLSRWDRLKGWDSCHKEAALNSFSECVGGLIPQLSRLFGGIVLRYVPHLLLEFSSSTEPQLPQMINFLLMPCICFLPLLVSVLIPLLLLLRVISQIMFKFSLVSAPGTGAHTLSQTSHLVSCLH